MTIAAAAKSLMALTCFNYQAPAPASWPQIAYVAESARMMAAAKEQEAKEKLQIACDNAGKNLQEAIKTSPEK